MSLCFLCLSACAAAAASGRGGLGEGDVLSGIAEDLWGESVDLGSRRGLVLIEPFSPANCGYCMIDGEFIEANYLAPNTAAGGASFYQCLFNPQRDILAYVKHMRAEHRPVLTFPPALHRYHRNGFPFLLAFRDGRAVYQGPSSPYEEKCRELADLLHPGKPAAIVLTSPSHLASRFIYENEVGAAVFVVPDGDEAAMHRLQERKAQWRGNPGEPRFEGDLTPEDLRRNLLFAGAIDRFRLEALRGRDVPVGLEAEWITIGPHRFLRSEVALRAAFPNPHNPERYVMLSLARPGVAGPPGNNWADYAVYAAAPHPEAETAPPSDGDGSAPLIEGIFRKLPGNRWVYADSLCFEPAGTRSRDSAAGPSVSATPPAASIDPSSATPCVGSFCPAPVAWNPAGLRPVSAPAQPRGATGQGEQRGRLWTLGGAASRFPALAPGPGESCWVAWAEHGDIFLACVGGDGGGSGSTDTPVLAIENDPSDSYDPVVVTSGNRTWILYLNDRDGFYRLRGRSLRGEVWSDERTLSEIGPTDAVTPAAAAAPDGRIVVAWTQWQANQRILRYRVISGDDIGVARTAAIAPSELEDYTNAWFPSLAFGADGKPWGAWNQHYPATLSVCAGDLETPAAAVTRVAPHHDDCEGGGYPHALVDAAGDRWVVWETFGWDVLQGEPQVIRAARFDAAAGAWGPSTAVCSGGQTFHSQTPCAAVGPDGALWVVWSGRDSEGRKPWSIYAARSEGDGWSAPERISREDVCARAPRVCASGGSIWLAWHEGVGEEMRVRALRIPRSQ